MNAPPAPSKADLSAPLQTWSIAEVERETGLGKDTLRVWERRYGFPVPLRDRLGERAYPHEQVQRLRLVKRLLDAGHRPGKVVPQTMQQLQALLDASAVERMAAQKSAPMPLLPPEGEAAWLQWLATDRTDLIRQALQQQIIRQGLGTVVDHLVAPLCALVGEGWLHGELFCDGVRVPRKDGIPHTEPLPTGPIPRSVGGMDSDGPVWTLRDAEIG